MTTTAGAPVLSHWVDGRPDAPTASRFGDVTDSATGEIVGRVPFATPAYVDHVTAIATAAAGEWARAPLSRRTSVLFAFRALVHEHREELAQLVTREHGKVLSDAHGEIQRGLEVVDFACGLGHLLKGEVSMQVSRGIDSYSWGQPLGVVAGITPFNFPVMVPMWMFPIAIAAGNAFILKPSEQDPSASLLLARLFAKAGLPDGVFNVVQGDREVVDAILEHPGIAAVSFVGSTPVARHVYTTATQRGKRVQALGGAKNHAVVLPDADLDLAADGLVSAGYGSAGQRCMAVSVAVAVGDVADPLVARLRSRLADLVVGSGFDEASQMGPLVSAAHRARVLGLVDAGVEAGAELVVDGRDLAVDGQDGFFVGPCLFDRVAAGTPIYDEEIFGPVLLVMRVASYADALELVNANPHGNGASIFTRDGGAARAFEQDVTAGMVGINVPIPVPMAYHSFGGWKASLFGDTHVHGPDGFRFYTRAKVVTRRWPDPSDRGIDLGFPAE